MATRRVVIVGGGFAGFHAAKTARATLGDDVEIVVINPTDYFLYLPLLPEVSAGVLHARRICVSLPAELPGVRLVLGEVTGVRLDSREIDYTDPEGTDKTLGYDRLVLSVGGVNKLLPVPGVTEHAHGFRGLPEALYLHDHITRQVELAAATTDPDERAARLTFVVVGAGYTGTEIAAHGPAFTAALAARHPELDGERPRWLLLDIADRVLPALGTRMARSATAVLGKNGVRICTGTSVRKATADGVELSTGEFVRTRTIAWCVGIRPDPLVSDLGVRTDHGRLVVDEYLRVPGHADVFACGDAAAVPDLTRPGEITGMTAQHAQRQGRRAGLNVAASLGVGEMRRYKHHDLGFVVDLGPGRATANPLHVPISGRAAKVIARGYHLAAMPGMRNRVSIASDWLLTGLLGRSTVQLGLVRSGAVPLDSGSPELPAPREPVRSKERTES